MTKTYARLETRQADLADKFGVEWATKLFGEEAVASLAIRTRGRSRGAPKGYVFWRKATSAGWCREVQSPLAVGQLADAWIAEGYSSVRSNAMIGEWLGRRQPLAGSAYFLFQEGRDRHAAEQTRLTAMHEAEMAEMRAEKTER